MKRFILIIILCSFGYTQAQIVNIPDVNFKAALLEASPDNIIAANLSGNYFKLDANDDGEIQVSEALNTSVLNVYYREINSFDGIQTFTNLIGFDCSANNLTELDLSQNINLSTLRVENNQLTDLDLSQNVGLISFRGDSNNFSILDISYNTNLTWLNLSRNEFSAIDITQNIDLEYLDLEYNQLTNLDVTQNLSLISLYCRSNLLTNLNVTQNTSLSNLRCSENNINSLDLSNNLLLEQVSCLFNNITHLDLSQNGMLSFASFGFNELLEVNAKNGNDERLFLNNNTNLAYLCIDENDLNGLDTIPENVVINSYCNFTPGGNYNSITGQVVFDMDSDGCGISDIPIPYARIEINDGTETGATFTDASGNYSFYSDSGDFTITPKIDSSPCHTLAEVTNNISFADNSNNSSISDFCITSNQSCYDVDIIIVPLVAPRPGFDARYQIVYKNKGSLIRSGTVNFSFDDTVLDYLASSIPVDVQAVGSITWNYTDLVPFETRNFIIVMSVNSPTDTPPINIGDELDFVATINPITDDATPPDNVFELTQTVVGAFDPNDKTCLEGDSLEPEMIGDYLHYNINFENTGTAAATFVVVKDEIDESMFDINTLQVMHASHDMVTNVSGQTVEFIFDNINLGPEEKGNVLFKIKTLNSLEIDDAVSNTAEIFFDFNFPIVTNTTVTTFETLSIDEFELDNAISVFPNPAHNVLEIKAKSVIESISLYDVQGRMVFSEIVNTSNTTINVSNFTSGIYFLNIQTERGEQVEKIIKN